jgi:hypothetical protein
MTGFPAVTFISIADKDTLWRQKLVSRLRASATCERRRGEGGAIIIFPVARGTTTTGGVRFA